MLVHDPPPSSVDASLARATLYRLLAHAFRHPGEAWQAEWDEIARGVSAALAVLAREGGVSEPGSAGLCEAFDAVWAASRDPERIRRDHAHLVGHSPRAGTTPYETEWTGAAGELLQYHLLADLAGFYGAFGLELAPGCDERQDHLALELCFLGFLCVREAAAEEGGEAEPAAIVRDAQRKFLDEHLLRWAPAFGARTRREDPAGFHGCAAGLLERFLESERARFALAADEGLRELGATTLAPEDCCVGCEHGSACAGAAGVAGEGG